MRVLAGTGVVPQLAGSNMAADALWFVSAPPNSFNLFCTYDLTYRLRATIDADGTQYTSEVIHQRSFSRNPTVMSVSR